MLILDFYRIIHAPWLVFPAYDLKNTLLIKHGLYFSIGMYLYFFVGPARRPQAKLDTVLALVALSLAFTGIVVDAHAIAPVSIHPVDPIALSLAASSIFASGVLALAISVSTSHLIALPAKARGALRNIGLATYPLYLLHEAVAGTILYYALRADLSFNVSLLTAITGTVIISLAVIRPERWLRSAIRSFVAMLGGRRLQPT